MISSLQIKSALKQFSQSVFCKIFFFFLYSLGLISLAIFIARPISNSLYGAFSAHIQYTNWSSLGVADNKLGSLLEYFLALIALFCYFICVKLFCLKRQLFSSFFAEKHPFLFVLYFLFSIFVNLGSLFFREHVFISKLFILAWAILLFLPYLKSSFLDFFKSLAAKRYLAVSFLTLLVLSVFFMFSAYVFKTPYISNDYMDAPETTILQGKEIDNTRFINSE